MIKFKSRSFGYLLIAITYVLATTLGVIIFNMLKTDLWLSIFIADALSTVAVFIVSVACKNASVYDPYWSVQPIVITIAVAFAYSINVMGIIIIVVISFWAIRLTANWAYTFFGLSHEDWRYVMLKEKTGKFYPLINFLGIHMVPTIVVYLCTMPAVTVIIAKPQFNLFSMLFAIVSLCAVILQGVSDIQMHKFRKSKIGGFIKKGFWKYSRHPNYLGEILMWWGVGLYSLTALSAPIYILLGAFANTLLFLFVSIPMADKKQSKKEGFAIYKKNTRMLLPIYKKQV